MPIHSRNLHTFGGFCAILLWSTTFAFARSLSEKAGPLTAAAAIYLIGGCFCFPPPGRLRKRIHDLSALPRSYLFGCGFLFAFYTAAIYLAVGLARDRAQLLEIALVNYLWPALTILFSLLFLKKRASFWLLPGTVLALAGVLLVMSQEISLSWASLGNHLRDNPIAYGLALLGAVAWALYSNLTRLWSTPNSAGAVAFFLPVTGFVLLALRCLANESSVWTFRAAGEALALAAVTALAYSLWDAAMRKGNLLLVAAFSYFTPLLSTWVSCAYLGVSAGPTIWIGCLLLVAGSLLTWRSVSDSDTPGMT